MRDFQAFNLSYIDLTKPKVQMLLLLDIYDPNLIHYSRLKNCILH